MTCINKLDSTGNETSRDIVTINRDVNQDDSVHLVTTTLPISSTPPIPLTILLEAGFLHKANEFQDEVDASKETPFGCRSKRPIGGTIMNRDSYTFCNKCIRRCGKSNWNDFITAALEISGQEY
jgi:hypothetical protein